MNSTLKPFCFTKDVESALQHNRPVIALESTIISHGMPFPENLEFAKQAEEGARQHGATPATIGIINGVVHIGMSDALLERFSSDSTIEKTAVRDLPFVLSRKASGATTVSATMRLAYLAGIHVFATGGIGGVHRNAEITFDVSQDLKELGRTPVIVVSAGAKAILDLPKTLEFLETEAVPIFGYQTDEFPAFYSRSSGLPVPSVVHSPSEVSNIFQRHRGLGLKSGVLIANPIPIESEIPRKVMDSYIVAALDECLKNKIAGKDVTPFLLKKIKELTRGESLRANIALALNNVKLASEIAVSINNIDLG